MPFRLHSAGGLEPFSRHRELDDDILVDLDQAFRLGHHPVNLHADDLGADRSVHNGADLVDDLAKILPLLGDEARVRGHAIDNPKGIGLSDVVHVRGV